MGDGTNPRDTPYNRKVNEVAELLIRTWDRTDPPVTASYVATFADMARAVINTYRIPYESETEEVQVRDLEVGDTLEDGRVVKEWAYGSSTHDPALWVSFHDGLAPTVYYDSRKIVRRVVK